MRLTPKARASLPVPAAWTGAGRDTSTPGTLTCRRLWAGGKPEPFRADASLARNRRRGRDTVSRAQPGAPGKGQAQESDEGL